MCRGAKYKVYETIQNITDRHYTHTVQPYSLVMYQFCAAGTGRATASQRSVEKVRELSGSKKHEFRHSPRGTSCQITKVGYRLPVLHPARRQLQRRHRSDKQQQQLSLSSCPLWQRDHPTQYITRCVYIHCSGISLLSYCCVTVNHLFTVAHILH